MRTEAGSPGAHRRLTEAAGGWERQGRDEGYLYRGSVLDAWQADAPDTLNETESAFLAASAAVQRRERTARRRRLGLTVAGLGVIGVVLSVLTYLLVVVRPDMPAAGTWPTARGTARCGCGT